MSLCPVCPRRFGDAQPSALQGIAACTVRSGPDPG